MINPSSFSFRVPFDPLVFPFLVNCEFLKQATVHYGPTTTNYDDVDDEDDGFNRTDDCFSHY